MTNKEYNQLLKFVYFEGYADSYADAETLLEGVSDEEFDVLCEEFEAVKLVESVCSYLISEGYTNTEQSAKEIVASMSSDWFDQIVETLSNDEVKAELSRIARQRRITSNDRARLAPGGDLSGLSDTHPLQISTKKAAEAKRERLARLKAVEVK
jgi:hypothetical protein